MFLRIIQLFRVMFVYLMLQLFDALAVCSQLHSEEASPSLSRQAMHGNLCSKLKVATYLRQRRSVDLFFQTPLIWPDKEKPHMLLSAFDVP